MSSEKSEVPVVADNKPTKSPNPTTGAALYTLFGVQSGYELWLEERGQGDDTSIANDQSEITIEPGSQFYTAPTSLNPGN